MAHLNTIAEANQLHSYVDNWSKVGSTHGCGSMVSVHRMAGKAIAGCRIARIAHALVHCVIRRRSDDG